MRSLFTFGLAKGVLEHVVDNHVRDTVSEPAIGSILYCDLVMGTSEHSGVYVGSGRVIHLNGNGRIEEVTPEEFVDSTTALSIYVGCNGSIPAGSVEIAERALLYKQTVLKRDYNVILDNCHQFVAACITGDLENANSFLWMLKHECEKALNVDSWRVWQKPWHVLSNASKNHDAGVESIEVTIARKMRLLRELGEQSSAVSDELYRHMDMCPASGEARIEKWERKSELLEQRLDGIMVAMDALEKELVDLEAMASKSGVR